MQVLDQLGTQGVQVDIAHQFQQVAVFLAKDGLVSILKDMIMAAMAAIELTGLPREDPAHARTNWCGAGAQQKMGVVGHQGPCKTSQ